MSTFEIPYEFSLHESPVTFTDYFGQSPPVLLEDLYATGSKSRKPASEVCSSLALGRKTLQQISYSKLDSRNPTTNARQIYA